jgi:lysophospholipase L1-like esterase
LATSRAAGWICDRFRAFLKYRTGVRFYPRRGSVARGSSLLESGRGDIHTDKGDNMNVTRRIVLKSAASLSAFAVATLLLVPAGAADAHGKPPKEKWVATWSASTTVFGVGSPVAQPDLQFPFPTASTDGVVDQTIRMVVKPDLWGDTMRFRFSNVFGDRPVTLTSVSVGLQSFAGNPQAGTLTRVQFRHQRGVTIQPGTQVWSDAVDLRFVGDEDEVAGRNLLVSIAVQGASGAISWHGKAVTTNYVTPQGSGDHTFDTSDAGYPYTSTSWHFLNAIDVMAASNTVVVCAFGDSITDGTASTINGNDRWSNDLSRRLHALYGDRVSVVNQGIGGNTVARPGASEPAVQRLDRDVLGLSGLTHVVWLEGINDTPASTPDLVIAGYQNVVGRLHAAGIKVIGATVTSALNPTLTDPAALASNQLEDQYRHVMNDFIRNSGLYDDVADFDAVTLDPVTGALKAAFLPPSSIGGTVLDWIHPNRAGYQAMANTVPLGIFAPSSGKPGHKH